LRAAACPSHGRSGLDRAARWPFATPRHAAGRRRAHSGHVADRRKTAQPFHLSGKVLDRTPQRG
jgi:hypothetical protein